MTAAPWPLVAGPQDPDVITGGGTWGPRHNAVDPFPVLRAPALGPEPTTDELLAESRQIRADLARAVELSRWARGAYDTGRAAA